MAVCTVKFLWISCVFEHVKPNVDMIKLSSLKIIFFMLVDGDATLSYADLDWIFIVQSLL